MDKNRKTAIIGSVLIVIVLVLVVIVVILSVLLKLSKCPNMSPLIKDFPLAKNSTVILLNITENVDLKCFEPIVEIMGEYPVDIYQIPCKDIPYFNISLQNVVSPEYTEAHNPLPVVFDEHYQNYLTNANINVTVNISASNVNPLKQEFIIYFCLFTDYSQFRNFTCLSSNSYWKSYNGLECTSERVGYTNHTILTNVFTHSSPDYVFIGIGSTIVPLDTFQFNFSVTGETISNPKRNALFKIEECSKLSDINNLCNFRLNITQESEAMCIVGSRPIDQVFETSFSNLVVKWPRSKPTNAYRLFCIALFIIIFVLVLFVVSFLCTLLQWL